MFEPIIIVVSREEVEAKNIAEILDMLNSLLDSPEKASVYREKVDIAFSGYNTDRRELFEIPEVRNFVVGLDNKFPFWLFFLSKYGLGLQCLLYCMMPPFLTKEAKARIFPERIMQLLTNRWLPAMIHICEYAGLSEEQIEQLTERSINYITEGRLSENGVE